MLNKLSIKNLGPAPELSFEFAPKGLNIITGDNGVGKTFALDLAWWMLTRTWADNRAMHPAREQSGPVEVTAGLLTASRDDLPVQRTYNKEEMDWNPGPRARPPKPGLVIYARLDGGFSVWDPERNYSREDKTGKLPPDPDRPEAYHFSKTQVWEGLPAPTGGKLCRGLLEDWLTWRLKSNEEFELLKKVLLKLSPPGELHRLEPAEPARPMGFKVDEIPTIRMPYGSVPVTQASAAVKRIISLAYMIVWAWSEHRFAAKSKEVPGIVLLWDEVESHLHPQWQRVILPAVAATLRNSLMERAVPVQVIATSHAPLVLASLEPIFNETADKLINMELDESGQVTLTNRRWANQGDAAKWLVSETFGLKQARSREAEEAIETAEAWMRGERDDALPEGLRTKESIERRLAEVLKNGQDRFWSRWVAKTEGAHR